jgi:PilZ domain
MALDNDSVSYLKALKQTVAPQAASAAAPAPARDPNLEEHPAVVTAGSTVPQPQFAGAEKRRSPRYKCEGSAEMREEGCDVRTWATFTDVSLHGCYVEAQATYPVGSLLHMKLAANGITVETKGTVRVSYPYLGMGIAFTAISDEERKLLKELLGTLSHPTMIMGPGIASSLPTCGPLDSVPLISDARAAIQALMEFFESHHILTREEFLRVLRKSQATEANR